MILSLKNLKISSNLQLRRQFIVQVLFIIPLIFFWTGFMFFLDGDPKKEIIVVMKLKVDKLADSDLEQIASEFYNELLNQLLRETVSQSNAKIREYIVAQALYNAVPNEVDDLLKEVEEDDWQQDPLGIAKTWDENQAKNELTVKIKEND